MRKTNRKNVNYNKNAKIYQSIASVIVFAFSLLLFFSLLNFNIGFIGQGLNGLFSVLLGAGAFILVAILLVFSALSIFRPDFLNQKLYILSGCTFFALLLMLDFQNSSNFSLSLKIKTAIELSTLHKGSGVIGGFFGYIFHSLLGNLGTSIFIAIVIIVSLILLTEMTVSEIFKSARDSGRKIKEKVQIPIQSIKNKKINLPVLDNSLADDQKEEIKDMEDYKELKSAKVVKKLPVLEDENEYNNEVIENNETEISNDLLIPGNFYKSEEDIQIEKKEAKDIISEVEVSSGERLYVSPEAFSVEETEQESCDDYITPPLALLNRPSNSNKGIDKGYINQAGEKIVDTLKSFKIDTKIEAVTVGPTVTSFEISPPPGIKLSKIVSLGDNIALSLAAEDVRIEAPIPGKSVVGIEVPNKKKSPVFLSEIIDSEEFLKSSNLPLPLGKDVEGKIQISSLDKMPHLLIAGQTGSGKSVCINTILISLIYKSSPEDVKLILIDPKVVELNVYNGIPHLLIPVVVDAKKASQALHWAVNEMEERYQKFAKNHVRDIKGYNAQNPEEKLPSIVIIIDELSDLMMVASKEVEAAIIRLAQMARAAGLFLVIATQRPSVDVITGIIKANIPSRISFAVSSQIDSRTILDMAGAEKLLGKGDMLFYPSFYSKPQRIQGAFVSDKEVEEVLKFVKAQSVAIYDTEVVEAIQKSTEIVEDEKDRDPLFREAVEFVIGEKQASISLLQRRLKIGYNRSANIVEEMERMGILSSSDGSKPRKVLVDESYLERL